MENRTENKKVEFYIWRKEKDDYEKILLEIQSMDKFIFNKVEGHFIRDLNLEKFAGNIFKEMIVSPVEARELEFWGEDIQGIDQFAGILSEIQEGFYKSKKKRPKVIFKKVENYQKKEV